MNDVLFAAIAILALLILLAGVRLTLGPTIPDRVVAFDTINTIIVASMILMAAYFGQTIFVDVALVYALLSFLGTLAIAKYIGGEL
ncbi:MAG: cation:proton antiporter [Methanocalculus sp. MSAO_Arc1]|uniref:cation:proton antiporter n=1 Tax=Methanocalculus TaxID=71151 RepID=UPI000FF54DF2|nr:MULTISPECIES: cation:proton antiporter [unclassified Methanocalculus]MCP1662787.1 multicomponent Na+:H+ antiporter subunit F [Methanocalculus sp. AMF5]RQD81071.1 MAG: cation:proton antiporter [Methanocalculus sp. MSAO_Arc1]